MEMGDVFLLARERSERDPLSRSSMENAIRIYIYIYLFTPPYVTFNARDWSKRVD